MSREKNRPFPPSEGTSVVTVTLFLELYAVSNTNLKGNSLQHSVSYPDTLLYIEAKVPVQKDKSPSGDYWQLRGTLLTTFKPSYNTNFSLTWLNGNKWHCIFQSSYFLRLRSQDRKLNKKKILLVAEPIPSNLLPLKGVLSLPWKASIHPQTNEQTTTEPQKNLWLEVPPS